MAVKSSSLSESTVSRKLSCRAYLQRKQHDQAIGEAEGMMTIAPDGPDGYTWLAHVLNHVGRYQEAVEFAEKAEQIDPGSGWPLYHAYRLTGRHEDAVAIAERFLTPEIDFYGAFSTHIALAIMYSELGRTDEAKAEAAEILKLVPNFSVDVYGERIPYKDPAQAERDMAALRKAGLK